MLGSANATTLEDGRYVIGYPYAHNPKKLMFIPFIDPDYKENPQIEPEDF